MPIYLHHSNLIILKSIIINKYKRGIEQFRCDYLSPKQELNQEDNELSSISKMNADEFDIQTLVKNGLHYDIKNNLSNDFVIVTRYGGLAWQVDWLQSNDVFTWHNECNQELINKANEIANLSMDEISKLFEVGVDPFHI